MTSSEEILIEISSSLDISPSNFKLAQERFGAVRDWLLGGVYATGEHPDIYLQGSFRLGTVVRPIRGDQEGDFDIDQVCEISYPNELARTPSNLKNDVGNRLRESTIYSGMLDDEGKRCWTLFYSAPEGRPGFHIDVLPAIPSISGAPSQIDITDKVAGGYQWSISNPNGYYHWFKARNPISDIYRISQRAVIFNRNQDLYANQEEVPMQLIRTPLQRAIQLMKRHRDVFFRERDDKPASIVITTIAAHVYTDNSVEMILQEFCQYIRKRYEDAMGNGYMEHDGVFDLQDSAWSVPNPVARGKYQNEIENFADKWNTNPSLASAFFEWVFQLERDVYAFRLSSRVDDLGVRSGVPSVGDSFATMLAREVSQEIADGKLNSNNYLRLIHLGIEGRIDWNRVQKIAQDQLDASNSVDEIDISKVNFYQVAMHQGRVLSEGALRDADELLQRKKHVPAFLMCCSILLGRENRRMVGDCITSSWNENVYQWPILKLAKQSSISPATN
jgi:Second Messenger Oligonucleotide or Dinucleotide Synthetase domain